MASKAVRTGLRPDSTQSLVRVGGRVASPPPPAARASHLRDGGARTLACFLVRQPRNPLHLEPLATWQTAVAGRPQGRLPSQKPTNANQTWGGPW